MSAIARARVERVTVRRAAAAALLSLLAVAIAACSSANTKAGVTKAQFIARADAVCRAEQEKLRRALEREHTTVAALAYYPRIIRIAVAIHEAADAKLEALSEPPQDVAPITRWLTARTIATTVEFDAAQALAQHLPAAARVQAERLRRSALALSLARDYSLTVCGSIE